jgi:hypothetical protein
MTGLGRCEYPTGLGQDAQGGICGRTGRTGQSRDGVRTGQNRLMKEKGIYVGNHKDRQAGLGRDRTGGGKNRTE